MEKSHEVHDCFESPAAWSFVYRFHKSRYRDLEPIALIAENPQILVSRNGVPARDLNELIAWVKVNRDKGFDRVRRCRTSLRDTLICRSIRPRVPCHWCVADDKWWPIIKEAGVKLD